MEIQPYLFFNGQCEEAIAFYREALQAETVMMLRFSDAPADSKCPVSPEMANRIMHATLAIGSTHVLMSDGNGIDIKQGGFSLSVSADDVESGERYFNALAQGGEITMPYQKTFWTSGFGMLKDRFGVAWMVNVKHEGQPA
ncbi:VOC family protein [Paraburkholderia heleia]|uniref:VOC family protein n=1 Tax=Paraburkholderia heleia TaxID=634127 RepID=UPI002AB687FF|nr:VOC family protein [Paraburkholderia heleia]